MTANLVSFSGGKDSTATLLVAIEQTAENLSGVFCDTGNEHEAVYEYVEYIQSTTGVKIKTLRQDFSEWWWRRRDYVRDKWPEKSVPDAVIASVLACLEKGPTGNPFLDLCMIKGRFPSRRVQFCTQYLKAEPATEYAMELIDQYGSVISWQGVRAEESPGRAKLSEREDKGGGYSVYRPIHKWKIPQVFEMHAKHGIKPNPLYMLGMGRVGCMPCINANKNEILEISKRFPEHIARIEEWENAVSLASKRANSTFFPSPGDNENARERGNIHQVVKWSQTKRGGKLFDMFRINDEVLACSSAYGLCE